MPNRLIASIIFAAAIGFSGQAFAHAHLKAAVPADKSVVTVSPSALTLSFTEGLNLKFTGIRLIGPQNTEITTGAAGLADNGTSLSIPLNDTLAAGIYTVEWHALSTDGHKTTGSYSFTVKP